MWDKKDTLVGTVRNWEQLSYNLSHNCYYVPGRFLGAEQFPIRYIALQERDSQEQPAIVRVGEVDTMVSIPRCEIPVSMRPSTDPQELYYYFPVKQWVSLPHRIEIRDTAWGKPLFTYRFLLDRCEVSWELFVLSSSEDCKLLDAVHYIAKTKKRKRSSCVIDATRALVLRKGTLYISRKDKECPTGVSPEELKELPRSAFLKLKKIL